MDELMFYRFYCKTCNDYVLHIRNDSGCKCKECCTEYIPVKYKDIPEDKLLKQRERYKVYKSNQLHSMFDMYTNPLSTLFSTVFKHNVIEADAGQKSIDDAEKKERQKKYDQYDKDKADVEIELEKYKDVSRNDTCICGSNRKYKKCCLTKLTTRRLEFRL